MATTKTKDTKKTKAAEKEPVERTTKREAFEAFRNVALALGKKPAEKEDQVGSWMLDLHRSFGGYRVHEITQGGGHKLPLGACRLRPGDFVAACEMILCALAIKEQNDKGSKR